MKRGTWYSCDGCSKRWKGESSWWRINSKRDGSEIWLSQWFGPPSYCESEILCSVKGKAKAAGA